MNCTVVGIGERKKNFEFAEYLTFQSHGETDSSTIAKAYCEKQKNIIGAHNMKITEISRRRNFAVNPYKTSLPLSENEKSNQEIKAIENEIASYIKAKEFLSNISDIMIIKELTEKINRKKDRLQKLRYTTGKHTQAERCRLIQQFRDKWDEENLSDEERELMKIGSKEPFRYTFIVVDSPIINSGV